MLILWVKSANLLAMTMMTRCCHGVKPTFVLLKYIWMVGDLLPAYMAPVKRWLADVFSDFKGTKSDFCWNLE